MKKKAYGALNYNPALQGKTLGDLFDAIRADHNLPPHQKAQVIGQVKGMVGYADPNMQLSALMYRGLGGTIGVWISKYFGMGPAAQVASAVFGGGLGNVIHKQLNKPKSPNPGWDMWA